MINSGMRIALVCQEIFDYTESDGKTVPSSIHGGFGFVTRKKAEIMSSLGNDVHVLVPSRSYSVDVNETSRKRMKGFTLHLFQDESDVRASGIEYITGARRFIRLSRGVVPTLSDELSSIDPDIIQIEDIGIYAFALEKLSQNVVYVFQDPFSDEDITLLDKATKEYYSIINEPFKVNKGNPAHDIARANLRSRIGRTLNRAGASRVYSVAYFISDKAKEMYGLRFTPKFIPNPIDVPDEPPNTKSKIPSVTFLARWDPQKRPDIALEAASKLPDYDFYFLGTHNYSDILDKIEKKLFIKYSKYDNIHIEGFVSEERKHEIMRESWSLLCTSAREGLPTSFEEAGANSLAIVSSVDPDFWATKFGVKVNDNNFAPAIKEAIEEEYWRTKGNDAYKHTKTTHESSNVGQQYMGVYNSILENS